jgi:hypothetical protein
MSGRSFPASEEDYPPPWLALSVCGTVFFGIMCGVVILDSKFDNRYESARAAFITECEQPIHECAFAWDKSRTLRDIYLDR